MITVERIEAVNIRSLGHAVFEPLTTGGMTAINGANGSGKSSLLAAMIWAMFGVTPDGVPVRAMRRQGSTGECRATVIFHHDGQRIEVTRELRGSKDMTVARVSVDGVETTLSKSAAATNWIKARLGGMDADGFMTAFVVRQKELDGLIRATPAERRKLIERLAGVDRMSAAVHGARTEENTAKTTLAALPGSAEDLRAAVTALETAQQVAITAWDATETAESAMNAADAATTTAEKVVADLTVQAEKVRVARDELTAATHHLQLVTERVTVAGRELDQAKTAATGGDPATLTSKQVGAQAAQDAVSVAERAAAAVASAKSAHDREATRLVDAQTRARKATESLGRGRAILNEKTALVASFPSDLDTKLAHAVKAEQEAGERVGALRGEHTRLGASIRALESSTDPTCPTCASVLTDPAGLLTSLQGVYADVARNGALAGGAATSAAAVVVALNKSVSDRSLAVAAVEHVTGQLAVAEQLVADTTAEVSAAQHATDTAGTAHEQAVNAASTALGALPGLKQAAQAAQTALRHAESAAQAAARIPELGAVHARTTMALHTAATRADAAKDAVDATPSPEGALRTANLDAATARATARAAHQIAGDARTAHQVAAERVTSAERQWDMELARFNARGAALVDYEAKTATRETLDAFRRDRIARLAPEMSEVATDFVTKMTDGKFTSVELDEEFTPILTDDTGQERPAAWLSGGEESAVALALRVAIGEIIAGQRGGVLFLDEVLTAQDANRRTAMMSCIRELPGRQIITINHVSEAADMVDLVVEVIPNEQDGSTVTSGSTDTGAGANTLDAIMDQVMDVATADLVPAS